MNDKQKCIRYLQKLDTSNIDDWLKYKIDSVIIELGLYIKNVPAKYRKKCEMCNIIFKVNDVKRKYCEDCRLVRNRISNKKSRDKGLY